MRQNTHGAIAPFPTCVLSLAVLLGLVGGPAWAAGPRELVSGAGPEARALRGGPGVVRARGLRLDLRALEAPELTLDLFPDVRVRAVRDGGAGKGEWWGHLPGHPLGSATFVVVDGVLAGSVAWPGRAYELRCDEQGACGVREVDTLALRGRADDALPAPSAARTSGFPAGGDSADTVEMLAVYTAAAAAEAGGTAAIQSAITLAVSNANQAYANSGVIHRLRLLAILPVSYSESGNLPTDLARIQNTTDGFMDNVRPLRSSYRADIVQLIVSSSDPNWSGYAYYSVSSTGSFPPYAYGVVEQASMGAGGGYILAHEAGHNLGSDHDRNAANGYGAYPYSFGYNAPNGAFGTIMAYPCGGGCPHVLHFSNPTVSYGGQPTGVSQGSSNAASNAQSMNITAGAVANFEQVPTLFVSGGAVTEPVPSGAATVRFNITVNDFTARGVRVDYFTSDGTATAGSDYVARAGTITFPADAMVVAVDVSIIGDGAVEPTERFYLNLVNAVEANIVVAQAAADITDPALISVSDATVTEASGGATAIFRISVANLLTAPGTVTVQYSTANGTALTGQDYTATVGMLTFPVNCACPPYRDVTVSILDDITDEFDETYTLNLSGATNAIIQDGQGLGTITDNDPLPVLSISNATVTEGATGTRPASFTVTLSPASSKTVTVDYATANGTANAGSDYLAIAGTLIFPPGATAAVLEVTVQADSQPEANETFTVELSNPVAATVAGGILYFNRYGQLGFHAYTLDPLNGGPVGDIAGSPYAATTTTLTMALSRSGRFFVAGSGQEVRSYRVDGTGRLIAAPGTPPTVGQYPISIAIDPFERFVYVLNNYLSNVITLFALDNQTAALTPIGAPMPNVYNGTALAISPSGRFLYNAYAQGVVGFRIDPATGALAPLPGSPYLAGSQSAFLAIDPQERFVYSSQPNNSTITAMAIDPATGALSVIGSPIAASAAYEVAIDPSGRFLFAGTSVGVASWTINANGSLTAFPGSPDGSGYRIAVSPDGRRVYGSYLALDVLNVDAVTPALNPVPGSPFAFDGLSMVVGGGARARATGTILNDDGPALTVSNVSVSEGNAGVTAATVGVTLAAPSANTVTVEYSTADVTASRAASDYLGTSGRLTFAPGQTLATAQVSVLGDTLDEPNETFAVRLDAADYALLGSGSGAVTIVDDDGAPALPVVELVHGSDQLRSLAALPGPAATRHHYAIRQESRSSYEVVIDGASGDVQPLVVQRIATDNSPLQTASFPGMGHALSLRFENSGSQAIVQQKVLVQSGGCGTGCGSEDLYRIRVYETTATIPRFNSSGSQITVVVLQNPTAVSIQGNVWFWGTDGALLAGRSFNLPARQAVTLNTSTITGAAGQSGTITVSHNGRYGDLAGKAVSLEPSTGFSFDTPLVTHPR